LKIIDEVSTSENHISPAIKVELNDYASPIQIQTEAFD